MRQVTINYTPQSGGPAVKNVYGWQDLVLNASYYAFGGATGALGPILPILVNGQPVSHPMILNQDGTCTLISPFPNVVGTIPVQNLKGNQALFIPFYNYPYSDFDDFNFPPDMLSTNQ
jgi:hypothetical protein